MSRDRLSSTFDDVVTPIRGRAAGAAPQLAAKHTLRGEVALAVNLADDDDGDGETRVLLRAGDDEARTVLFLRDAGTRPRPSVERSAAVASLHRLRPRRSEERPSIAPAPPEPAPAAPQHRLAQLLWPALAASLLSWLLLLSVVVYQLTR